MHAGWACIVSCAPDVLWGHSVVDEILYAPAATVRAVQEANFSATLDLVFTGSSFYRKAFQKIGLCREDVSGLDDLRRLPVTTKADLVAQPREFVLEIPDAPIEMRMPWEVLYTTGSTGGNPTPFQSNTYDFYNILTSYRRMLTMRGVGPDDILGSLYPITQYPQGAYIRVMNAASALHIPVVALLPGRPSPHFREGTAQSDIPAALARLGVTAIWGVPSFVRSVLKRANEQSVALPALHHLLLSGEPLSDAGRADIEAHARAVGSDAQIKAAYGGTELQAGLVECRSGSGFHNVSPEEFIFEIVDPTTHEPLDDGIEGLLLVTHLNRRGTVLLRYAIGDVAVMTRVPCPHCGATVDRIVSQPRRADERLKIKGMLVDPSTMIAAVEGLVGSREFRFRVTHLDKNDKFSMDSLELMIAGPNDPALGDQAAAAVKAASGVTPSVSFVTDDAIIDPGRAWKMKRVVDDRPK